MTRLLSGLINVLEMIKLITLTLILVSSYAHSQDCNVNVLLGLNCKGASVLEDDCSCRWQETFPAKYIYDNLGLNLLGNIQPDTNIGIKQWADFLYLRETVSPEIMFSDYHREVLRHFKDGAIDCIEVPIANWDNFWEKYSGKNGIDRRRYQIFHNSYSNLNYRNPLEFLRPLFEFNEPKSYMYDHRINGLKHVPRKLRVFFREQDVKFEWRSLSDRVLAMADSPLSDDVKILIDPDKWMALNNWERIWLMTHEYGHEALGLTHNEINCEIMFPISANTFELSEDLIEFSRYTLSFSKGSKKLYDSIEQFIQYLIDQSEGSTWYFSQKDNGKSFCSEFGCQERHGQSERNRGHHNARFLLQDAFKLQKIYDVSWGKELNLFDFYGCSSFFKTVFISNKNYKYSTEFKMNFLNSSTSVRVKELY